MEQRMWPSLQLRLNEGAPGQFDGIAVPYDTPARVGGYTELVARGAVDPDAMVGLPILWQHDTKSVAGVVKSASSVRAGVHVTGEFIDTSWGRDAQAAVRSGAVTGLSIGFDPVEESWDAGNSAVTRTKIEVRELSLATLPVFTTARVTATRAQAEEAPVPETPVVAPEVPTYATRGDLEALEARMVTPATHAARHLGVVEAFVEQLRGSAPGRQLRALADVINTGNAGVLPPQWSSEVRNFVDTQRYMIPQAGSVGFPTAGYSLTIPKVLVHTLIAPRGAQKSELPSRALTTGSDTYTATWYAGAVDVALELIWQSDPSIWEIVARDLLWAYADTTDKAFTLAVEGAGQPTGAAIVWTDWGTVVGSVLPQSEAIRVATGQPGDRLSLTTASWGKLIGLTDGQGRRVLAPGGPQNSDGSAALLDRSVNMGGIVAFHNPRAVEDVMFNQVSVRVAEKPPVTITQENVPQGGRDIGVIGAVIDILWPAGIKTFAVTELAAADTAKKK